ncbi:MAG: AAA family ATPase, partial [Acidobacteriota bacterium]
MRIDSIQIESLASLRGEQPEIRLTGPALADSGLIAITGPTGAGKSTILDAVCLALFDQTPRLSGRGRDPRDLLSRGAGIARAVVRLTLDDGRRWTAEWSVHRARQEADGNLQASRQRILDTASGEVLADQKRGVQELVHRHLGLTFGQFTGVILLAQGEFAKFLEASDAERSELLEKLTGTEIYSELSRAAFERHKALAERVEALDLQAQSLQLLEGDARRALEQELDELEPSLTRLEEQIRVSDERLAWIDRFDELDADARVAAEDLAEASQAHDGAAEDRTRLEGARLAAGLAGPLKGADAARAAEAEATRVRSDAQQSSTRADRADREALRGLRRKLRQLDAVHADADAEHRRSKRFAGATADALGDLRRARSGIDDAARRLERADGAVAELTTALEAHTPVVQDLETQTHDAGERLEAIRGRAGDLERRIAEASEGRTREQLATRAARWDRAHEIRLSLDGLDLEYPEELKRGLNAELRRVAVDAEASQTTLELARRDLDDQETLLRMALQNASVAEHRHLLEAGQPCPLCGSLDHPRGEHGSAEERGTLRRAEERRATLRSAVRRAEEQTSADAAEVRRLEGEIERAEEQGRAARRAFDDLRSQWIELRFRFADLPEDAHDVEPADLSARATALRRRLDTLEALDQEGSDLKRALETAEADVGQVERTLAVAFERRDQLMAQARRDRASRDVAASEVQSARAAAQGLAAELAQTCGLAPPEPGALDGFLVELDEGRRRLEVADQQLRRLQDLKRHLGRRGRELLKALPAEDVADPESARSPSSAGDPEALGLDLERAVGAAESARRDRQRAADRLATAEDAHFRATNRQAQAAEDLERALRDSPFEDVDTLRNASLDAEETARLRERLEALRLDLERCRVAEERSRFALDRHRAVGEPLGFDDDLDLAEEKERWLGRRDRARTRRGDVQRRKVEAEVTLGKDDDNRRQR